MKLVNFRHHTLFLNIILASYLLLPNSTLWAQTTQLNKPHRENLSSIDAGQIQKKASRTVIMTIQGEIKADLIPKVIEAMAMTTGDPLPAGFVVLLNSQGGDGLAAIEVGRLLRQAHAHVFVTDKCASACVFILMGGVVRQAPELSIGIHRARLTAISKKTGKRIEINADANPKTITILEEGNRKLREYVKEMGMSEQFSSLMEATPVDRMRWLSRIEARELDIIGIEEDYLKQREAYVMERFRTKPGELKKNTDEIIDRCAYEFTKPNGGNFVRCYHLGLDRPSLN